MEFLLQPLTLVTFFPLLGVLVLLFLPSENKNSLRWTALVTSLATFGISLWVLSMFNASNPDLQLVVNHSWITVAGWDIHYSLGVDGLSILLLLLTTFITPISILSTWTAVEERVKDFMVFFLLRENSSQVFGDMCCGERCKTDLVYVQFFTIGAIKALQGGWIPF